MNLGQHEGLIGDSSEESNLDARLKSFHESMREYKRQEELARAMQKDGVLGLNASGHFLHVNPDELLSEDMDMWEAVANHSRDDLVDTLTKFYENYKKRVQSSGNESRQAFSGFLGNKIALIMMKRDIGLSGQK